MFVLDKALSIPSGVMSTRDRMLARAGLGGVVLEAADWPDGVVGVPGDGRGDGLAAKTQEHKGIAIKCGNKAITQTLH